MRSFTLRSTVTIGSQGNLEPGQVHQRSSARN